MKERKVLFADEGKILTDGTHYGRIVYLTPDDDGSGWYEITEEEYAANTAADEGGEQNAP